MLPAAFTEDDQPTTTDLPSTESKRVPCPIPPGWSVQVEKISGTYGSVAWRGVRISAKLQCGHGFHFGIRDKCDPAHIDPNPSEEKLPNGEVVRFLPEEAVELKYDEDSWLAILWRGCVDHIRDWQAKYCDSEGCCLCRSAKNEAADNPYSAS